MKDKLFAYTLMFLEMFGPTLLILAILVAATLAVNASKPFPKVRADLIGVRPPKEEAENILCIIEKRQIIKPRKFDEDFEVTLMNLDCLNGHKYEMTGIEH